MENKQYIKEDTIDLQELWDILVKRKLLIISVTLLFTLGAILYSYSTKPIYEGNALIEIGEVIVSDHGGTESLIKLNDPEDLKNIVITLHGIDASVPRKSTSMLKLSYQHPDRSVIKKTLQAVVGSVMKRHEKKAQWFSDTGANVHMSQLVGKITVSQNPVKPKKILIILVALITGLMFSVFLTFFLEFIRSEEKK